MTNQELVPIIMPEEFQHNALIVTIDRSAGPKSTHLDADKLYECTRKSWIVDLKKAQQVDYVIAKYKGILKEIYQADEWYQDSDEPDQRRFAFNGQVVTDPKIRKFYLDKKLGKKTYGPLTFVIKNNKS